MCVSFNHCISPSLLFSFSHSVLCVSFSLSFSSVFLSFSHSLFMCFSFSVCLSISLFSSLALSFSLFSFVCVSVCLSLFLKKQVISFPFLCFACLCLSLFLNLCLGLCLFFASYPINRLSFCYFYVQFSFISMILWTRTVFECFICIRFLFLYLHLFSAVEHVSHGKAL